MSKKQGLEKAVKLVEGIDNMIHMRARQEVQSVMGTYQQIRADAAAAAAPPPPTAPAPPPPPPSYSDQYRQIIDPTGIQQRQFWLANAGQLLDEKANPKPAA